VADEAKRGEGGKAKGRTYKKGRNTPNGSRENYCTDPECKWEAWRLWAAGCFSFKQVARGVNSARHPDHPQSPDGPHDHHWAERSVDFCGVATREAIDRGGDVALAQLLQGYQADLQAQLGFATTGTLAVKVKQEHYGENGKRTLTEESVVQVPDNNLRSLARTRVTEVRSKMAAALGVVTERKGMDLNVMGDMTVNIAGFEDEGNDGETSTGGGDDPGA
jgi:hypothetical protein